MNGYIKLYRSMLETEWHDDPITTAVWVRCLLKTNYETKRWHGVIVEPGQFITSYNSLAKEVGITVSQLRTALKHLKSTHQLTCKATNKATLVTIENWALYQSAGDKATQLVTRKMTTKRQDDDTIVTTTKEIKKERNKEERDIRESDDENLLQMQHGQFSAIKARLASMEV